VAGATTSSTPPLLFPCNRWLAADMGDGRCERELFPASELPAPPAAKPAPLHEYLLEVATSELAGAGGWPRWPCMSGLY
jgi:hypothetical protein